MKALKNWFSRRGALPLTAYLLALAVWLVLGAVHFGSDAAARLTWPSCAAASSIP